MEGILKDGRKVWIYWPDQCDLCKGRSFRNENESCNNDLITKQFMKSLRELEHSAKGVYGRLEFKCDYFCLDDEKFHNHIFYRQQDCGECCG